MNRSSQDRSGIACPTKPPSMSSAAAKHWALALFVALAAFALALVLLARAASVKRHAYDNACVQQMTNDEHASMEAFFQNPSGQDALLQVVVACSK
ncbi:hypothetical protein LJR230_004484 [Trinickia sp. LjRoot230]|uniref:hypothetical protein n=1 Tax=Trinickia sp. LjRoot230 TaxID=3342288 RepID=UPI003ECE3E0B